MIALIQRVNHASVVVNAKTIGAIHQGILALIGIEKEDTEKSAQRLLERIITYRIFSDEQGKMNRSLQDIRGELLLVSQFTLVADTRSGTRPSFSTAMAPESSQKLFTQLISIAQQLHPRVATGEFGANMQISLCNDGPVTFLLRA